MSNTKKRSRKDGGDDVFKKKSGGVDYNAISDKRIDDKRHEREKAYKEQLVVTSSSSVSREGQGGVASSTFDAFQRMATGKEGRTLAEKISDPNRPTWEQYKKDNEDKLDNTGAEMKKMAEYRAQLDREREERLSATQNARKRRMDVSDSDDDATEYSGSSDSGSDHKGKKKKKRRSKKEKKTKKDKSKKKSKKRKKHSHHSDDDRSKS